MPSLPDFRGGAGNDRLVVNDGTYAVASDLSPATNNLSLELNGNAVANISSTQHLGALKVSNNARVNFAAGGTLLLRTNSLEIGPAATVDLADNSLIVQSTPLEKQSALAAVSADIVSARAGGTWTGPGLTSSAA